MALGEAVRAVAGIGCRSGTPSHDILAALDAALVAHGRSRADIRALASVPERVGEPGLIAAANSLGVALESPTPTALLAAAEGCLTASVASRLATGLPSASEAAALAASGGRLLGPRVVVGRVTCALAEHSK